LSMALGRKDLKDVVIGHRSVFDPREAKERLGLATGAFGQFLGDARKLSKKTVTTKKAEEFVAQLLVDTKTVLGDDVYKSKQFQKIMGLFAGSAMGGTLGGTEGTMWGVVN